MLLVGGMVVLAAGGTAAAVKMSKQDAQKVEQQTGKPPDQLTEEELKAAMQELGIQSLELTDEDKAAVAAQSGDATTASAPSAPPTQPVAPAAPGEAYLDELEKLAALRDKGIITDEEFENKKKQLLGL